MDFKSASFLQKHAKNMKSNQRKKHGKWKSEMGSDVESGDVTVVHTN